MRPTVTLTALALVLVFPCLTKLQLLPPSNQAQNKYPQVPNEVVNVDLMWRTNLERHHTKRYRSNSACLVLRRGEIVNTMIDLYRPYNKTLDKLRLELSFGTSSTSLPTLDDGSLVYIPIANYLQTANNATPTGSTPQLDPLKYEARIESIDSSAKRLSVNINLPSTMPVGIWRLKVSSKLTNWLINATTTKAQLVYTYTARELWYVLFNAWNSEDDVYLARADARDEYLMNEIGKIYIGSNWQPVGRKWTYGQFDEFVLPVLMHLLERTKLSTRERSSAVKVSRAVSAIVNSHDENGLIAGNWSGNYGDGLAPWQWNGSPPIFRRYVQNGYNTVKFGQCWVFGGLTTTSLRALGIPARSISNFVSAHDTDSSLTVDKFYSHLGSELSGVNGDSIWNFHVWSDAWMQRPDLPAGFGGWQAIDATPQEKSMGLYQLGPASLEAIKRGKVGYAYDVAFVFSEVNANVVYWHLDGRARLQWRKTRIQTGHVGRKILTKMIGLLDERSRTGTLDAEDIVDQYKFADGSAESRLAQVEATRGAGLEALFDGA